MLPLTRWRLEHALVVADVTVQVGSKAAVDVLHSTTESPKQQNMHWPKRMQPPVQLQLIPRLDPVGHLVRRMDQISFKLARIAGPQSLPCGEGMMPAT